MKKQYQKRVPPSELRLDLVSGDWVLIATGRAQRPETFKNFKRQKQDKGKGQCPFCKIETQEDPCVVFVKGERVRFRPGEKIPDDWTVVSIPNKFPAVLPPSPYQKRIEAQKQGPLYKTLSAVGYHEVVVTRDHKKQIAQFSKDEIKEVIDVYQQRYLSLKKQPFVEYISIFHNHGQEAGASISHPHSQILTTPLIDLDLKNALNRAENFFKEKGKCIYCAMNEWEIECKDRVVFENEDFLVVCPFASKAGFEMIISPKKHRPYFEEITETEKQSLAESLGVALNKLYKGLNDPPYNFYLHTAPCDQGRYLFYHWHLTILPKTSIPAGFEIGTKIEISTIEPEKAAQYLREQ